jgi:hypothetical protein
MEVVSEFITVMKTLDGIKNYRCILATFCINSNTSK